MPKLAPLDKTRKRRRSSNDTRMLIISIAASELIETKGALEMSELAKHAKLSEGLAYYYFGNRAGVIAAVVDAFYDRYEEKVIAMRFEGATWQIREQQRVKSSVEFFFNEPLTSVVFSYLSNEPEVVGVEKSRFRRQIELTEQNILEAQANGHIAKNVDAGLLGAMMHGAIRWGIMKLLQSSGKLTQEDAAEEIWLAIKAMSRQKR